MQGGPEEEVQGPSSKRHRSEESEGVSKCRADDSHWCLRVCICQKTMTHLTFWAV